MSEQQSAGTRIIPSDVITFTTDLDASNLVGKPLRDDRDREVGTITAVEAVPGGLKVTAKLRDDITEPVTIRVPSGLSISGSVQRAYIQH